MKGYIEQSAAGKNSAKNNALYTVCIVLTAIFVLAALLLGANLFGNDPNVLKINLLNVIGAVICLAAAGFVFLRKDYLRMEYDYVLSGNTLEVCGVLNRRRRKLLLRLELSKVLECGRTNRQYTCAPGTKMHAWYANADADFIYLIYMESNIRHTALLELNEEFVTGLRRHLNAGVWRNGEGKT